MKLPMNKVVCFLSIAVLLLNCKSNSQEAVNGIQRVDPKDVEMFKFNDVYEEPLSSTWARYNSARSDQMRQILVWMMTTHRNQDMSPEIEHEICRRFERKPSVDGALLLGMCSSDQSLNLLLSHEKTTSPDLLSAIKLARARRGNVATEQEFIQEFKLQLMGKGMLANNGVDQKSEESARHLEYIGSIKCILTLCDAIISIQEKETTAVRSTSASLMVKWMHAFLEKIKVPMPEKADKQELVDWWKETRLKVSNRLQEKGVNLPRLTPLHLGRYIS
jgi:hypothetical protein